MSAISLKSITGITSITTPAGVDNQLTLHNNNTTEAVKLDTAGNLHFHNHLNITGVSTASNFKTGSTNVHSTGVELANINTGGGTATFGGGITVAGAIDANGDLDVDGHTNLDNVNIAGVTTTSDNIKIEADNKHLSIGAHSGGDLLAYHDGNKSVLVNYTGDFHIRTNNGSRSSLEGIILKPNGATEIYHSGSKVIETDSLGVNVDGRLDVVGTGANDHLNVGTNTGRLRIGGYADLQLFHDSTNINYISNHNDIDLHITSTYGGSPVKTQAKFIHNGAVELYHNDGKTFETTNEGVTFDTNSSSCVVRLTSNNNSVHILQAFNNDLNIKAPSSGGINLVTNASNTRLTVTSTGRIEIGTGTHINASAPMEFKVSSSSSWGNYPEHITLTDQKAYNAADNGAGIQFGGKYNNAGNATTFGSIHGRKQTTGDGNYGGFLTFNTREHGNSNFERLRIDSTGRVFINAVDGVVPSADYRSLNLVAHAHTEAGISFSRSHTLMGSGSTGGKSIILLNDGALSFQTHNVAERMRIDSSGRVVIGGTSAYIGGANLAVMGTGTSPNTYGSFAIGKVGANPTGGTTLANIRLNGGSIGTRRGAEINAVANSNWTDGSSHPTKLTFAVANVNSASATERYQINHYGHHIFTNENVFASSPGTNSFKGLSQHGYQHWGQRQYYSGQQNMAQNDTFDLFSNNVAHDDIIFWLNIKGFHANRTFATAHGTIGGYGLSVSYQSATGVHGSFSAANITSGRNMLRWTSNSQYSANWWIWGWFSGTSSTGTHTGYAAAQNF